MSEKLLNLSTEMLHMRIHAHIQREAVPLLGRGGAAVERGGVIQFLISLFMTPSSLQT